jgi:hypothetical protein
MPRVVMPNPKTAELEEFFTAMDSLDPVLVALAGYSDAQLARFRAEDDDWDLMGEVAERGVELEVRWLFLLFLLLVSDFLFVERFGAGATCCRILRDGFRRRR